MTFSFQYLPLSVTVIINTSAVQMWFWPWSRQLRGLEDYLVGPGGMTQTEWLGLESSCCTLTHLEYLSSWLGYNSPKFMNLQLILFKCGCQLVAVPSLTSFHTVSLQVPYLTMYILKALLCSLSLFLLYHGTCSLLQRRRLRNLSKIHGCAPPPTQSLRLPWGVERVFRLLSFRGDILDDLITPVFHRHRAWTVQANVPLALYPLVFLAEPANVKAILATNFADWGVGSRRLKQFGPFLGLGVFTADGHSWSSARSLLRPVFTRQQVSDLEFTTRHADRFLECLGRDKVDVGSWTEWTDATPFIYRFTLDAATEFLFGESVNSQAVPNSGKSGAVVGRNCFEQAFEASSLGVGGRMRLGSFYWLLNHSGFRNACNLCRTYVTGFVDKALGMQGTSPTTEKPGSTEKDAVFLRQLAESTQDRIIIRDQLMQLLFAGRDTTATLISFALLCLARNPDTWDKLRREALNQFGKTDGGSAKEITFENLKGCSHLQHVLQETLRLYPPIPVNARQALRDTVLPTGGGPDRLQPIAVPRGTTVTYSVYVMQRRADLWGEDAAEWKPDRWEGMKGGFHFLPFNAGPRHCPGRKCSSTERHHDSH